MATPLCLCGFQWQVLQPTVRTVDHKKQNRALPSAVQTTPAPAPAFHPLQWLLSSLQQEKCCWHSLIGVYIIIIACALHYTITPQGALTLDQLFKLAVGVKPHLLSSSDNVPNTAYFTYSQLVCEVKFKVLQCADVMDQHHHDVMATSRNSYSVLSFLQLTFTVRLSITSGPLLLSIVAPLCSVPGQRLLSRYDHRHFNWLLGWERFSNTGVMSPVWDDKVSDSSSDARLGRTGTSACKCTLLMGTVENW